MATAKTSVVPLTDRPSVLAFWHDDLGRGDPPRHVEFLAGGVSSNVVRVTTDDGGFVIKQALSRLRVDAPWFSRPERSAIEVQCAIVLADLVPGSTPEVVASVPERQAFVMRAAPAGTETWKARLMRGETSSEIARSVGSLLGRIHARSAARRDLAEQFNDRSFFDELRIDPYMRYVAGRDPSLAPALETLAAELLEHGTCLTHGDFSPKNLLVDPADHVLLVDHEVAHWGRPAFDVGFVTSHLCLKAIHFRPIAQAYLGLAVTLLDAYAAEVGSSGDGLGRLAARATGACIVARVDGKSPVEYLDATEERDIARHLGEDALLKPPPDPWALVAGVGSAIARA